MITLTFEVATPEEASRLLNRLSVQAAVSEIPAGAKNSAQLGPKSAALGPPAAPGIGVPPSPAPLASPAVVQLMQDNGIETDAIAGSGKDGRITKADVTAYLKANTPPTKTEEDPFALDDDPPAPAEAEPATKEQVRTALVTYQTTLRDSLIANGTEEEDAVPEAMSIARGLLNKVGGAGTLGGLDAAKYGDVVLAATAATNELSA